MVDASAPGRCKSISDSLSRHRFAGCVRRGPLREHPLRNRPAQKNLDLFDYSASTMMSEIAADAVAAAEDSTLASYIDSVHHQLAHLVQLSNWSACDNFLEAKTFVAPGRVPSYMLPEHARGVRSAYPIRQRIQVAGSRVIGRTGARGAPGHGRSSSAGRCRRRTAAAGGSLGPRPMPHCQGETSACWRPRPSRRRGSRSAGSAATTGYKPLRLT